MASSASPQRPGESEADYERRLRKNERRRQQYHRRKMGESLEHIEARLVAQEIGIDRPAAVALGAKLLEQTRRLAEAGLESISELEAATRIFLSFWRVTDGDDGTTPELSAIRRVRAVAHAMLPHDDADAFLRVLDAMARVDDDGSDT